MEGLHIPFETRPQGAVNESPGSIAAADSRPVSSTCSNGSSSIEATAFYDVIAGHMSACSRCSASPETQATFDEVVHQVAAMNGAARGMRISYTRRFNDIKSPRPAIALRRRAFPVTSRLATLSPDHF
jgi:hypothetical protein